MQLSDATFVSEFQALCARHVTANLPALTQPLKPSEAAEAFLMHLIADVPCCVWGPPGISKSQTIMQAADKFFAERYDCVIEKNFDVRPTLKGGKLGKVLRPNERPWFKDFRCSQHDAVDLTGVPFIQNGCTAWAPPALLKNLDPRGGLFFLDELNRGTEMTRNSAFQLCDPSKSIGDVAMPTTWTVFAACNEKGIGVSKLSDALTRRFIHYTMTTDVDDVSKYAIARGWEPVVIAYLRLFPDLLNCFDPKEKVSPNPRGWEFISKIVAAGGSNSRVQHAAIAGTVGDAAAVGFSAFLRLFNSLPSIDAVLLNPKKADVPTEAGSIYAIAAAVSRKANARNFDNALVYLDRLPVEYAVFAVTAAIGRDSTLQHTAGFTRWSIAHQDVTF